MDCTELWASLKQLWLLEAPPSIPTIGPWEPAATGGILLPPKVQKHMENPARLKFDPQFPTKVFANRRKSGTRRKVPFADLPREIWTKKITHLPICRGSPKFFQHVFLSSMAKRWYFWCIQMRVISYVLYEYSVKTSCKADQWHVANNLNFVLGKYLPFNNHYLLVFHRDRLRDFERPIRDSLAGLYPSVHQVCFNDANRNPRHSLYSQKTLKAICECFCRVITRVVFLFHLILSQESNIFETKQSSEVWRFETGVSILEQVKWRKKKVKKLPDDPGQRKKTAYISEEISPTDGNPHYHQIYKVNFSSFMRNAACSVSPFCKTLIRGTKIVREPN